MQKTVNKRSARYFFIMMLGITNLSAMTDTGPTGSDRGDVKRVHINKNTKASSIIADIILFKKYCSLMVIMGKFNKDFFEQFMKSEDESPKAQALMSAHEKKQEEYSYQLGDLLDAFTDQTLVKEINASTDQLDAIEQEVESKEDYIHYWQESDGIIADLATFVDQFANNHGNPEITDAVLRDQFLATVQEQWEVAYNLDEVILAKISTSKEGENDPEVQKLWEQELATKILYRTRHSAILKSIIDPSFVNRIKELCQAIRDSERVCKTIQQEIESLREVMPKYIEDIEALVQQIRDNELAKLTASCVCIIL